jgi:hypothetical protein
MQSCGKSVYGLSRKSVRLYQRPVSASSDVFGGELQKRGSSCVGHFTADWKRNGGAEDVIGIVMPLGFDDPLDIPAMALNLGRIRVAGVWWASGGDTDRQDE